jgi:hypothetical protein
MKNQETSTTDVEEKNSQLRKELANIKLESILDFCAADPAALEEMRPLLEKLNELITFGEINSVRP